MCVYSLLEKDYADLGDDLYVFYIYTNSIWMYASGMYIFIYNNTFITIHTTHLLQYVIYCICTLKIGYIVYIKM